MNLCVRQRSSRNYEKLYLVSEAARITGLTSETLRHCDRIGLIKPSKKTQKIIIVIIARKILLA